MTPEQFKMAKSALDVSNPEVAKRTGLHRNTINTLDKGEGKASTVQFVRLTLEAKGGQFLEAGQVAAGPGVTAKRGLQMRKYAAILVALAASPLSAEPLTGNELLTICEQRDQLAQQGFCTGYILGALEGIKWGVSMPLIQIGQETNEADSNGNVLLGYCMPGEATLGQQRDVVVQFLLQNPSTRHGSARTIIQNAFKAAFPCG